MESPNVYLCAQVEQASKMVGRDGSKAIQDEVTLHNSKLFCLELQQNLHTKNVFFCFPRAGFRILDLSLMDLRDLFFRQSVGKNNAVAARPLESTTCL